MAALQNALSRRALCRVRWMVAKSHTGTWLVVWVSLKRTSLCVRIVPAWLDDKLRG